MRTTLSPCSSTAQTFPSGPAQMPAGELPPASVNSVVDKLRFAQANPIGLILNFAERDDETFGGYGYGQSFVPQPGSILHG